MIKLENVNLNLKDTITCGQIFRFKEEFDSYTVILSDRVVNLKMDNDTLIVKSNNEENLDSVIRSYLDLDRDYDLINKKIIEYDNNFKSIIDECSGFKMINQPKFECLISYIISQNNRVTMISKVLDNISKKYGKKVIFEGNEYYLFPTFDEIKDCTVEDLRELKTGFRDKYIYEIIQKIKNNEFNLDLINDMDSECALKYLMNNKGIGEKVASCILLFAYFKTDVYPIDTWVKKYMLDEFNINNIKDIRKYTNNTYKEYSGLAIQYMFHVKRNKS